MHTHLLLAITTLSFTGPHGFYSQTIDDSQLPTCPPSMPCRLLVNLYFWNGTLDFEVHRHPCVCPSPYSCSDDWSLSSQVISLKDPSIVRDVNVYWMFCQAIQPQRQCDIGEEALVMSGVAVPSIVVSFNCRCSDSTPLQLKERTKDPNADADYPDIYHYVCNSHMPACQSANSYCSTRLSNGMRYNCKCPIERPCDNVESSTDFNGNFLCRA